MRGWVGDSWKYRKHERKLHGTEARARRHRRDGEKPCEGCLEAEAKANRLRHQVTGWRRSDPDVDRAQRDGLIVKADINFPGALGQVEHPFGEI